jgi:hypothetical protein
MSKVKALIAHHHAAADKSDLAVVAYEEAALNCGSRMDAKLEQIGYLKHAQSEHTKIAKILQHHQLEATTLDIRSEIGLELLTGAIRIPETMHCYFRAAKWDKLIGEAFMSVWRLLPAVKHLRRALVLMTYAAPPVDKYKVGLKNIMRKMKAPRRATKTSLIESTNALGLPLKVLFPVVLEESKSFTTNDSGCSVVGLGSSFFMGDKGAQAESEQQQHQLALFVPSVLDDLGDIIRKQKDDNGVYSAIVVNRSLLSRNSGGDINLLEEEFRHDSFKLQGDMIVSTLVAVSTLHLWTGCMLRTFLSAYYALQMSSRMGVVSDDLVEAYSLLYMSSALVCDNAKISRQCFQFVEKFIDNMGDHSKAGRCRITCALGDLSAGKFESFHKNCERAEVIFASLHDARECRRIQLLRGQEFLMTGNVVGAKSEFDELQSSALERNDTHLYSQCCLLKLVAERHGKVDAGGYRNVLQNVREHMRELSLWSYGFSDLKLLFVFMDLRARIVQRIKGFEPKHTGPLSDVCIQPLTVPELDSSSTFHSELSNFVKCCDMIIGTDQICHHLYMTIAFQVSFFFLWGRQ